jgi:mannose-6-phosphate isomerase-like protein (cupin superfamily)
MLPLTGILLLAQTPLAKRIVHTDPARYSTSKATHAGAGELRYQTLVPRGVLTDLAFVHRGLVMPKSSIGHHFHNTSEEMFFILGGEAQFTVDGRTSVVQGPVGVPSRAGRSHALYNPSDQPLEWMNINVLTASVAAGPGARDPMATFDLGDDRVGVPLDPKPVFMTVRFSRDLLRPSAAMNGGKGTVQYRRAMGPSVYSSKWAYMDHLVLPPGTSVGPHMHPGVDEFYYVVGGEGSVKVGDETAAIRKSDGVPLPMGEVHSFENTAAEPLEFLILGIAKDKSVLETKDVK